MSEQDNRHERLKSIFEGILAAIRDAEDHIGAERGVISNLPRENSFVFMIGVYGVLEPILNDLLSDQILTIKGKHKTYFDAKTGAKRFVQKQNFSTKAKLLRDIGLLGDAEYKFVEAVALVRNRYGHNIRNLGRTISEIAVEEGNGSTRLFEAFAGLPAGSPYLKNVENEEILKFAIFEKLANLIADALKTLKPPPTKMSGLFGFGSLGGLGGLRPTALGGDVSTPIRGILGDLASNADAPSPSAMEEDDRVPDLRSPLE